MEKPDAPLPPELLELLEFFANAGPTGGQATIICNALAVHFGQKRYRVRAAYRILRRRKLDQAAAADGQGVDHA